METARAAVIPSQWEEPFGMVVVEAMAAGVAPIVSAHGSFPEMVVDNHEGILFLVMQRLWRRPSTTWRRGLNSTKTLAAMRGRLTRSDLTRT